MLVISNFYRKLYLFGILAVTGLVIVYLMMSLQMVMVLKMMIILRTSIRKMYRVAVIKDKML
jgi:hypothetical protein